MKFAAVCQIIMIAVSTVVAGLFIWIYVLFIILLQRPDLDFLKC